MIKVIDGTLYQWGIDREIEILNPEIKKVAFANNHHCGDDPIDVVDGKVILPNKFLQSSQNIDVYGLDQDGNEIYSHQLEVNGKMKPSDYNIEIEGGGSSGGGVEPLVITGTEMLGEFTTTDSTTYEDVKSAVDANRPIVIKYDNHIYSNMNTVILSDGVIGFICLYYSTTFSNFHCSSICFYPDGSVREFYQG